MHHNINEPSDHLTVPSGGQESRSLAASGDRGDLGEVFVHPGAADGGSAYQDCGMVEGPRCRGYDCPCPYLFPQPHDSPEAVAASKAEAQRLFAILQRKNPGLTWTGWLNDEPAAWRMPLLDRPAGQQLRSLRQGDHLVTRIHDLGLGNRFLLRDLRALEASGVELHLVALHTFHEDAQQAPEQNVLSGIRLAVELDCAERSELARARAGRMRPLGRAGGRFPPRGYKRRGRKGHRRLVPDLEYCAAAAFIAHCREQMGLSWWGTADAVERVLASSAGRRPFSRGSGRRQWSASRTRDAYFAFRELYPGFDLTQLYPSPNPNPQIPEKAGHPQGQSF